MTDVKNRTDYAPFTSRGVVAALYGSSFERILLQKKSMQGSTVAKKTYWIFVPTGMVCRLRCFNLLKYKYIQKSK